jgi:hypothetical protein
MGAFPFLLNYDRVRRHELLELCVQHAQGERHLVA